MNRSQYEATQGSAVTPTCSRCKMHNRQLSTLRLRRHKERAAYRQALSKGVTSGKIIVLFSRDEFTGWHYRRDASNSRIFTGKGSD